MKKRGGIKTFLILSLLGLLLVNLTLISGYLLITRYGQMTLNPGEEYTINIPFSGSSKAPVVCGKAEKIDGTALENVKVKVHYSNKTETLAEAVTDEDGKYCITLPEINTNRRYDVYVEYDNGDAGENYLALASNDYKLDFEDDLVYSKSKDARVPLTGEITNEDAEIEDGRFEVLIKYRDGGKWKEVTNYQKYSVDIEPNEVYEIPEDGIDFSWIIPSDAETGEYKFYIKTSFNAKEHTKDVYFNITS